MTEAKRLDFFTRILALGFLTSIGVSGSLWLSNRLYPLAPLVKGFGVFPLAVDYAVFSTLIILLLSVAIWPRSQKIKIALLALLAVLFLQDQNRLWPSFYEFSLFFVVLAGVSTNKEREGEAYRVLNVSRFILAGVYFWSGFLKLTPNFYHITFPWFLSPLTSYFPLVIPYISTLAIVAAVAETIFAVGLLTKFLRTFSFWEAIAMHTLIFFLIGPFRGDWNDSAWIWSGVTCSFLWILFYRGPVFEWKKLFSKRELGFWENYAAFSTLGVVLFVGIVPALNLVNTWPSNLSFNVYTGNVSSGEIFITKNTVPQLPSQLQQFVTSDYTGTHILDVNAWSAKTFNANPVPRKNNFLSLLSRICSYAPSENISLLYQEKSGWGIPLKQSSYSCTDVTPR